MRVPAPLVNRPPREILPRSVKIPPGAPLGERPAESPPVLPLESAPQRAGGGSRTFGRIWCGEGGGSRGPVEGFRANVPENPAQERDKGGQGRPGLALRTCANSLSWKKMRLECPPVPSVSDAPEAARSGWLSWRLSAGLVVALLSIFTLGCEGYEVPLPETGRVSSPISGQGVVVRTAKSRAVVASIPGDAGDHAGESRIARDRGASRKAQPRAVPSLKEPLSVLFIGNSYTFYHRMPALVADIASSAGHPLEVTWATNGGYQLGLHATDPVTLDTIRSRPWDVVVLQNQSQQPGFRPEDVRVHTLPIVERLAAEIRESQPEARILLYSTWGRRAGDRTNCEYYPQVCSFEGHTDALEEGYGLYAEAIGADMALVGRAFKSVYRDNAAAVAFPDLYEPDGSHPSLFGSYLAASVFFYSLTGISPEGLGFPSTLLPEEAAYLQQIAAMTVRGEPLEPPAASVVTRERLVAKCDAKTCGPSGAEGAPVTRVVLFEGTCSDWYLRTDIELVASVEAELVCSEGACSTQSIDTWASESGDRIPAGTYSVFVSVDRDLSGGPSKADLEACEDSIFSVGGGRFVTIERFYRSGELS